MHSEEQMPGLTLEKIAEACGGTYQGPEELKSTVITGVVRDNRDVKEGNLFVAIRGERTDGHRFIPAAFAAGAAAVLAEQLPKEDGQPVILVDSTIRAMKKLAAYYRNSLNIQVVGITGSVGKTSTKEMIASVLAQKYCVLKTEGNYNNEIGLPLTIFRIRAHHQAAVLEMGISDFGEMTRLSAMAQPDVMVITNIGLCHLENLGTRDGILNAKTECFANMKEDGTVILNGDDDKLSTKSVVNGKVSVFYGIGKEPVETEAGEKLAEKTIYAVEVENHGFEGLKARIYTPEGDFCTQIPIPGKHNVYNALAATAAGLALGLTTEEIDRGIREARTIAGRTNVIETGGMKVVDDCYNANPISMKAALELLSRAEGRKVAVLGDMGELGADERKLHHEVGVYAGQQKIDALFAAGSLAQEYAKGLKETDRDCLVRYFADRASMTEALLDFVEPGDYVLVKASHFMEFPKVVEALQNKERE